MSAAYQPTKWDRRFLELARFIARWSKDPSTQVGAVIATPRNRIVATGFNGLPAGVEDTMERLKNRALKYEMVVHAERNAVLDARQDLTGCSLYVWPLPPCAQCAAMIIQTGIASVIAPTSDNQRWTEKIAIAEEMFREAGVALRLVGEDWDREDL